MKLQNKPQIDAWLEANDLNAVLEELKRQLKADRRSGIEYLRNATSLSAQLEKLRTDKVKGIITYEEETIAMNKLLDKVQLFVERIEKGEVEPIKPVKPTKPAPSTPIITQEKEPSNAWKWWTAAIVLVFAVWWIFFHNGPTEAEIRVCTSQEFSDMNWCNNDLPRFTQTEVQQYGLMVSAGFTGSTTEDPYVTADLVKSDGAVFPTERIILTMVEGGVGYATRIEPTYGAVWWPGTYILKLNYNDKPVGEKLFEIIGNTNLQNDDLLLPLDSIKVKKRDPISRLDSLLQQK